MNNNIFLIIQFFIIVSCFGSTKNPDKLYSKYIREGIEEFHKIKNDDSKFIGHVNKLLNQSQEDFEIQRPEEINGFAKIIHKKLFTYFFPKDPQFIAKLKTLNITPEFISNGIFKGLSNNPLVTKSLIALSYIDLYANNLLKLNQVNLNKDIGAKLNTIILSQDKTFVKICSKLRQIYLYFIYNDLIGKALGIQVVPTINNELEAKKDYNFPSKLKVENDEIKHKDGEIDYLIIGSGPGASSIAHELVKNKNLKVVIIEKGPFIKPQSKDTEWDQELMESSNTRTTDDGLIQLRAGRGVGGGTLVNVNLSFPPHKEEALEQINNWIKNGSLFSGYVHDKNSFEYIKGAYSWVEKTIGTRKVDQLEVNENNKILKTGSKNSNTYYLNRQRYDPNKKDKILKISSVDAFLWKALQGKSDYKGSLSIIPNCEAIMLNHSNNRVTSVTLKMVDNNDVKYQINDPNKLNLSPEKEIKIKAKRVILCGGGLNSPELLLRSKINNENTGCGVILHPSMGVAGCFDRPINMNQGLKTSVFATPSDPQYRYFLESMGADLNFLCASHPGNADEIYKTAKEFKYIGGFGVMLVDSVSKSNRVYINESGQLDVHYKLSEKDKRTLKAGLKEAIKILFEQGAKYVILPSQEYTLNGRSAFISSIQEGNEIVDNLKFIPGLTIISSAHIQASNKMGQEGSVISQRLRVKQLDTHTNEYKEFENLYVVDSSSFPSSVGVNPMQSIYTLGKLFVDSLLKTYH